MEKTENPSTLALNRVHSIRAAAQPDVFIVHCNITDIHGRTYDCDYGLQPDDPHGLAPSIRQWMLDKPTFPIGIYVPPTVEEVRAGMPSLTARQFRLGLVNAGISQSTVAAIVAELPAGPDRDKAQIEWEYATTFNRTHPLIATIGAALGLAGDQIDEMWQAAASL
ncbi:hypothetical protein [Ensifer sp.]|jgi:hypothetical protein|uniref:hypothetical protein n=1 Tax=Ensifer sp. TaxID=1872086 RepID=UPI002E0E0499|nr:hypothetical protein [Ensifer sp.]